MIPATAEYLAYESQLTGATPAVRVTFLPYLWPNGVNDDGDFVFCEYVAPDRIENYYGFADDVSWISPVLTSNVQVLPSPAVVTWDWNSPGFDLVLYWRGADDVTALAAAAWIEVDQGDTIDILPFHQFKLTLEGYRAWAEDDAGDDDDFTAWAVDVAGVEVEEGYASDVNVPGDLLTYIEALEILGEFTIVRDIEQAGSLSMEAPTDFSDLVAGDHSGLLLNNRQGSFDESLVWTPAPLFSPNKSSFFLTSQDWYGIQLKIELGWSRGGWFESGFGDGAWLLEDFSDFITLFWGTVKKWGPVSRAADQTPNTVEIYATDFITDCLQKLVALPAADGTPNPLTFGEFLCAGEKISGWSPAPVYRAAYFEENNFNELTNVVVVGGTVTLITPGLTGARALRASVTGSTNAAYGVITFPVPGEMFITGTMRFKAAPASPGNLNSIFLKLLDAGGAAIFAIQVNSAGDLYGTLGGQSTFNILAYLDVPLAFAMWYSPANPGYAILWINGDEILSYTANLTAATPIEIQFGAETFGVAESWTVDFDDIEVRTKYYKDAFKVSGSPFTGIGAVYIDNLAQPDSKTIGSFVQTLTRYPAWGMVQFTSTDPEFEVSGEVLIRVIKNAGGLHALAIIESLLAAAGLTASIDAVALAAAYVACPNDIIHARFDGGGEKGWGLKDVASMGVSIGDCLKEICSRCLYWLFVDHGVIKIVPYTGIAPASPSMALTASNLREVTQTIDLERVNAFVTAIYGWYARNSSLFYVAGTQEVGGQGTGLDYTWDSPVACERLDVVKAKADLLLKYLSTQECLEPVRTSLAGARLELIEVASVRDVLLNDAAENYWITRKEVGLDPGSREVSLQLMRFLGE